jgi:hypothetical protein
MGGVSPLKPSATLDVEGVRSDRVGYVVREPTEEANR